MFSAIFKVCKFAKVCFVGIGKPKRRRRKMIRYYKLFDVLNRRDMKRTDLKAVITAPTITSLGKGSPVSTETINKICEFLDVQPGDIMEYIPDNKAGIK